MTRSTRTMTATVAAFATLAPAAMAMPQDGGIPTSSLAGTTSPAFSYKDLRSPDARDAAAAATRPHLASSHKIANASVQPVHSVRVATSDGFDWADAGIGAGGAFGTLVLLAGTGTVLRRRVRPLAS